MEQTIKAEIEFIIPSDHVLIKKTELEELKQRADQEWISGLSWLSEQTGIKSPQQLKEKLLYPFRKELEDFVYYPRNTGETWRFNTVYMKEWLRKNFRKVNK